VCFGGGVFLSDAQKQANEFIKALQVPCVCTLIGLGVIETENPLFLGMIGVHGKAKANSALHKADLLCIVGARLCDRTVADTSSLPKDFTVIHIDVDPAEIGKNIKVNIPVVGDARSVLNKLNEMINKTPINNFTNWCNELDVYKKPVEKIFKKPANGFINPKQLCYELSKKLDNDAIVIADVGQNQIWSAANIQIKNGRFLTSGGMGTMGYSLPCAMGVKSADNSKQVVSICGDGSFQMCFMELATLVQNNINIKIIVMKNNSLGMVREIQKNKYGGRLSATVLSEKPDFSLIASAYGIKSLTLNNNDNISEALDLFLKDDQCFLLECIVDPEESTL
ncbi:MAG: thiamine pyrophosphate-binding protein, partial [Oscillospiraceae bacterium]